MEKTLSLRFSPKQKLAAQLLADGVSQSKASQHSEIKVTKQTLNRWAHDPDFQDLVEELRTDLSQQAIEILEKGQRQAAKTVVDAAIGRLDGDAKVLGTRLKAALYILDFLKVKKLPSRKSDPSTPQRDVDKLTNDEVDELMED